MDFQAHSESSKFLGFLGPPYKSFCAMTTLKNGVIFLAVLYLIGGIYFFILLISALVNFFAWSSKFSYYYIETFDYLLCSIGIIFFKLYTQMCRKIFTDICLDQKFAFVATTTFVSQKQA